MAILGTDAGTAEAASRGDPGRRQDTLLLRPAPADIEARDGACPLDSSDDISRGLLTRIRPQRFDDTFCSGSTDTGYPPELNISLRCALKMTAGSAWLAFHNAERSYRGYAASAMARRLHQHTCTTTAGKKDRLCF